MSDIVADLRSGQMYVSPLAAADEIERLRGRVSELLGFNNDFEQRRRDAVGHNEVLARRVRSLEITLANMVSDQQAPETAEEKRLAALQAVSEMEPHYRDHIYLTSARPIEEYHEDMGDVLWWKFPITEAPYVGTPNDLGFGYQIAAAIGMDPLREINGNVGGWPGDHTHFTPIPIPQEPKA